MDSCDGPRAREFYFATVPIVCFAGGGVFSDRDVDGGITSSGWLWFPVFCPVPIPALEMCVPWSLGTVRCLTSTLMMS